MKVYAGNRFCHVKSGHLYEIQTLALQEGDLEIQVVYQRVDMDADEEPPVWVRPARDFFDGRFVMLPGAQEKPAASPEVDRQLAEMLDREGRAREADMMAATAAKAERAQQALDHNGAVLSVGDSARLFRGAGEKVDPRVRIVVDVQPPLRLVQLRDSSIDSYEWMPCERLVKVDAKPSAALWDSAGNVMKMGDKVRRTDGSPIHYLVAGFDSTGRQVLCAEPDTSKIWWPAQELVKVDDAGKTD